MWRFKQNLGKIVNITYLKIAIALISSFYLSQSFGTTPDFDSNVINFQARSSTLIQKIKNSSSFITRKPTYDNPEKKTTGFTFIFPTSGLPLPSNPPVQEIYPTQVNPSQFLPNTTAPQPTNAIAPTSANVPTPLATVIPTQSLPPSINCPSSSSESYDSLSISGSPTSNANNHGDINLRLRGYALVDETKDIQSFSQNYDSKRPQLKTFFSPGKGPDFYQTYRVYNWNFSGNSRGSIIDIPPVTMIGLRANPGEGIRVPDSGYSIGSGKQVLVLYADSTRITLKYTREDNVVYGYTIHIEDYCTDPNLVSYYNQKNSEGRSSLPALAAGKKIGVARTGELKIVIRDTGSFMDPRMKDWW